MLKTISYCILFYDFSTSFLFNHLVNKFIMSFVDFILLTEITSNKINYLIILCLHRMHILAIIYDAICLVNCKLIITMNVYCKHRLDHLRLSLKKWHSYSSSSPNLFGVMNSNSIVDHAIVVCLKDFHNIARHANVTTYSVVDFEYFNTEYLICIIACF